MPLKTTGERAWRARRAGVPLTLKDVEDRGGPKGISRHAAKKPRHNGAEAMPTGRHVSRRAVPGEGRGRNGGTLSSRGPGKGAVRKDTVKPLDFVDERQALAIRNARLVRRKRISKSIHPSTVQGRKKAPSQMHVKRKGGPRKRLRIHGG